MAADKTDKQDTKLAVDYETIRRKEHEVITDLLDVLPRIETVGEDRITQVRDALFHADNPFLMVFVGPFSSGKSSILNALLSRDLLRVGPTPTTDRITILRWGEDSERMSSGGDVDTVFHPSPLLKKVSFVDTPGTESIFREHEQTTRKFLHRSDVVFMVLPSMQAMSAKNLEVLQELKQYGKNIIILINQADLLDNEEVDDVRQYVQEQSQARLGYKPDVWFVSAKHGLAANEGNERDADLWEQSGLTQLERYIDKQLGDVQRLRQKLQTPLQISQNAATNALTAVRENQTMFDKYAGISENVRTQIDSQQRTLERIVRDEKAEIDLRFQEAIERGRRAIGDQFSFSRALGSVGRGTLELVRMGNLLTPADSSAMRAAFERHKVFQPLQQLPQHVNDLSSRLEGRDLQDIDNLVGYAREQTKNLPDAMQEKMIGRISASQNYDRAPLLSVRDELEHIEDEAQQVQVSNLDEKLRNSVVYLAIYEIVLLLFGVVIAGILVSAPDGTVAGLLVGVMLMMAVGLLFVPLRGHMLQNQYSRRMQDLQQRYLNQLDTATDNQLRQGKKLREDAVMPLLSLIESQTETQNEQLSKLQNIQQRMVEIESSLADLGKSRLLAGLRG